MQVENVIKHAVKIGVVALLVKTGIFKNVGRGWPNPTILGGLELPSAFVLTGDDGLKFDQIVEGQEHQLNVGVMIIASKPDAATTLEELAQLEDQLDLLEAQTKQALNEQQPGTCQLIRWFSTKTPVEWAAISKGTIVPMFHANWSEDISDPSLIV